MLLIQQQAIDEIIKEFARCPVESGGLVIGFEKMPLVTGVITSSDKAERSFASYYQNEKDVDFLNMHLRKEQSAGREMSGYYHKHPPGVSSLSGVDLKTGYEVLRKNSDKIDVLLMLLTYQEGSNMLKLKDDNEDDIKIKVFSLTIDEENNENCREIEYKVIPDMGTELLSLLGDVNKRLLEKEDLTIWDENWQFYNTPYGKKRLSTEIEEIKDMQYEVECRMIQGNLSLEIILTKDISIVALLPREYPTAPPRLIICQNDNNKEITSLAAFSRWSSLFSIKDLIDDLKKQQPGLFEEKTDNKV